MGRPQGSTQARHRRRLEQLEHLLLERGWSRQLLRVYMETHGISESQAYDDRRRVLQGWQDDTADPQVARSAWLQRLRRSTGKAQDDGDHKAVAALLRLEGQALQAFDPVQVNVGVLVSRDPVAQAAAIAQVGPLAQALLQAPDPSEVVIDVPVAGGGEE